LFAGAIVMLSAARASASYHLTKIVAVESGSAANANASYVQLRSYAAGQNFLGGHSVQVFDAAGTVIETVNLANVANGGDQANVLIGTAEVNAAFGVAPDFTLAAKLNQAGGKVCFDTTPIDCFAWGNYAGSNVGVGTNFAALTDGMAATRKISGGTNTSCLDPGDDTNDSAADFTAVTAAPKSNNSPNDSCAMPEGGTTTDSGTSGGDDAATPVDSGVSTTPTPPREGGTATNDAGSASSSSGGGDDSGCNTSGSSDGWSTGLGLLAAATIFVLSRRRRAR
jgi:hypothetical protein